MLYLPTSWWHEVTFSSSDNSNSTSTIHVAFNYWFYPPDGLTNFDKPYRDVVLGHLRGRVNERAEDLERVQEPSLSKGKQ